MRTRIQKPRPAARGCGAASPEHRRHQLLLTNLTTPLSQPASGTQGLVAIDALGPAGEYRTRNHEVITNTAGATVPELSLGRAPCAPTWFTPLSHRARLCPDHDDSTKENRTP
jgi:hypothetical protein